MSKTMLAAVLHGVKDLRVDERAIPELEPGNALVRVRRGGICGSAVHYFEEGRFGSFAVTAPFVLGHEVTGEVVRRGGTMVQIGVYSAPEIPLPVNQLLVRELPLGKATEALELACAKTGVVKVQIDLT